MFCGANEIQRWEVAVLGVGQVQVETAKMSSTCALKCQNARPHN
jgi:alanine dehydrogenase